MLRMGNMPLVQGCALCIRYTLYTLNWTLSSD